METQPALTTEQLTSVPLDERAAQRHVILRQGQPDHAVFAGPEAKPSAQRGPELPYAI